MQTGVAMMHDHHGQVQAVREARLLGESCGSEAA